MELSAVPPRRILRYGANLGLTGVFLPNLRVRPRAPVCDGQTCALHDGGVSCHADNNPLSARGADLVVRAVMQGIAGHGHPGPNDQD